MTPQRDGSKRTFNKVFEIGVPKTGTTSLAKAYKILGLKQKGWSEKLFKEWQRGEYNNIFKAIESFDAFQDGPWHDIRFPVLDQKFPNSKFIILERDNETWYRSMEYQYKIKFQRDWFLKKSKSEHINKKIKKYEKIKAYFKNRPNDLLALNIIEEDDPWEKLCGFLGLPLPLPKIPFPHINKGVYPKNRML